MVPWLVVCVPSPKYEAMIVCDPFAVEVKLEVHVSALPVGEHEGVEKVPRPLEVNDTAPVGTPPDVEELGRLLTVAVHVVGEPSAKLDGLQETAVCVGDTTTVVVAVEVAVVVLTEVVVLVVVLVETVVTVAVAVLTDVAVLVETVVTRLVITLVVVTCSTGLIVTYDADCPPVQTLNEPTSGSTSSSILSPAPIA